MKKHYQLPATGAAALLLVVLFAHNDARGQYALQYGAAVAAEDRQVFVGEGRNLLLPGSVFVYTIDGAGRNSSATILSSGSGDEAADGFGRAIAVSGTSLFVGAPQVGRVFVFGADENGAWSLAQTIEGGSERFGSAVSVSGSTAAVAAPGGRQSRGEVAVYATSADGWRLEATLTAPDTARGLAFGSSVAAAGDVIAVGAPGANQRAGTVYVFERRDGLWGDGVAVEMPGSTDNDRFGISLIVRGDRIAVGAPGADRQTGVVLVFAKDGETGSWEFERRITAPSSSGGEMFGTSIAMAGNDVIVGAPGFGNREGAVYRFMDDPSAPYSSVELIAPESRNFRSSFGNAVAASEDVIIAGAVGHDNFEGAAFPLVATAGTTAAGDVLVNDTGEYASVTGGMVECSDGSAEDFTCSQVDMLSFLTREDIGARRGIQVNDVWGWEDPITGREYALVGRTDGTSFVDLTDPHNPVFVGDLPKTSTANQSIWRDVKVYKDHAFIVSDGAGAHHMQVFDLTQLRNVQNPPRTFEVTALYKGIYSAHNIVINEETGFAYAVGSDSGGETCGGALHMINIQDPTNPQFAGCFADVRTGRGTGATHDAQCVVYHGPDADYGGREVCLSSNGTALSIADVTDKDDPKAISIAEYPNVAYTHQGWLTEDHRYFYLNDEGDEVSNLVEGTRTLILDLADLDDPVIAGEYIADHNSIDHNLYVRGNVMYQTNYSAGLRLLDISDPENPVEIGHFDTVPYGANDNSPVLGAWSNYPYFKSGVIVVTSGREGVFFLKKRPVDI